MSQKRRRSRPQDSRRRSEGRPDRKAHQLCRQVSRTLSYVLSGECHDDVLRSLFVESVTPAPDSSRLLVTVAILDKDDETPIDVILTKLAAVSGKLRTEVAHSITRRKTPELIFNVVRPEDIPIPEREEDVDEDFGEEE